MEEDSLFCLESEKLKSICLKKNPFYIDKIKLSLNISILYSQQRSHKLLFNTYFFNKVIGLLLACCINWSLFTIQTPLRPLIKSFWNPHFQYARRPNPSSLETPNEITSIFSLEADRRLRIIRNKITFYCNSAFILPNFFIESFWHFLMAVSWCECFICDAGWISPY